MDFQTNLTSSAKYTKAKCKYCKTDLMRAYKRKIGTCIVCRTKRIAKRDLDKRITRKLTRLFGKKIIVRWEELPKELRDSIHAPVG